jgi:hypothetical protein
VPATAHGTSEVTMLRRAAVVTFSLIALAACGRQVTPNPSTNNLDGRMVIQFTTQGPMNFSNYNYVVIFNTCGINGEPYPNAFNTSFYNYSYAFVLGGGAFTTEPTLIQYLVVTGTTNLNPSTIHNIGPSTVFASYPYLGQTNTFQINFLRSQLNNPAAATPACPPGGGPSPTPVPSISPTPGPTSTPNFNVNVWYINFFVLNTGGTTVVDSLGGPTDSSQFRFSIDTTRNSQNPIVRLAGAMGPSDPAAFITGGEIDNYVTATPSPSPSVTASPTPSPTPSP